MAFGDNNFNPASVMMNQGGVGIPYIDGNTLRPAPRPPYRMGNENPQSPPYRMGTEAPQSPAAPSGILGPQSVRATGSGPFDAAYRQNLATYGGGMYGRPGGSMNFNPTDMSTFPGQPTGGGNAPVSGMPLSMLDMALGGQPFSFAPPQPPSQPSIQSNPDFNNLRDWMDEFWKNGRGMRAIA